MEAGRENMTQCGSSVALLVHLPELLQGPDMGAFKVSLLSFCLSLPPLFPFPRCF